MVNTKSPMGLVILDKLPAELLVDICRRVDDFKDAVSLGRTSRILRAFWQSNGHDIYLKWAPRFLPGYESALYLLALQRKDAPHTASNRIKAHHLRANDRSVSRYCDRFEARVYPRYSVMATPEGQSKRSLVRRMSVAERARFHGHIYKLWSIQLLDRPDQDVILASMTVRELWLLTNLCSWIVYSDPSGCDLADLDLPPVNVWKALFTQLCVVSLDQEKRLDDFVDDPCYTYSTNACVIFDECQGLFEALPDIV